MLSRIDKTLADTLLDQARQNPRRRSHHNFHQDPDDAVQRLAIGLLKGSYIRPHLHPQPYKWEMIQIISGAVDLFIFTPDGRLQERLPLRPDGPVHGIEMAPNTLHTILTMSDEAVIFEVKQGPYTPAEPGDFAAWAPAEGNTEVGLFLKWLEGAQVGECYGEALLNAKENS